MTVPKPEYLGWLMFCSVFLADTEGGAPYVWERHLSLTPLFWLAMQFEQARIFIMSVAGFEPGFRFRITGRVS